MSTATNHQKTNSANAEEVRYFNEYANGIGYINGVRDISAEGKPPRYAAQVSVIQGPADNVHYEYHDLIVGSETALGVILENREAIESDDSKVLIRFNMANPRAKAFIYKQGERAGELGSAIGGFLTRILTLKINNELAYEDNREFDDQAGSRQVANG
ncbi:STY4534 family ICE replication protein (plasmid) [Maricurvus nonylphenolicus]|uniref:DUF3577 domain-containing protein n=1 Tax=Maricurvus nonylphenolicus TaxID=1008307 RepID=UPI0036F1CB35